MPDRDRMDSRVAVALALALLCAGASPLVTAQSPPSPTVSVGVDAQPLDRGDTYHTQTDPVVDVNADAQSPIDRIEVRIDGATRHAFEPSSQHFERSIVLDLETGAHRLTVVARADGVATHESTVVLDDEAPVVNYSDPFESESDDPDEPPTDELTVNRGNVTINGSLTDISTVDTVRVDHEYAYETVHSAEREGKRQHLTAGPGGNFSQPVFLALGDNEFTVQAEDAVGNARVHQFTVTVEDDTEPSLTITDIRWESPTRLHIEGYATDNVQVQSVWVESGEDAGEDEDDDSEDDEDDTFDVTRHPFVFSQGTEPDRDRHNATFGTTAYHPPDTDYVVIGVNDTAGNEQTWNYTLSEFLAPNITIHDERTGYVADRRVAVGGRVTEGQVRSVRVETLDPETGQIVDLQSTTLDANGSFATRLDGAPDETRVRVRVRDASGADHLANTTVTEQEPTPSDPAGEPAEADDAPGATDDPVREEIRIPFVGIVVPVPQLGSLLGASVTVPLPFVGPIDVPLLAIGGPVVLVAVLVRRR